jgi:hypothetical protein
MAKIRRTENTGPLTRQLNRLRKKQARILADRDLWDPSLPDREKARNKRFVHNLDRLIVDLGERLDRIREAKKGKPPRS